MKHSWFKLFFEILDDPKMGRMPDRLWRRAIELMCLAGENGKDGLLPSVDDMTWRLRTSADQLSESLQALSAAGIVHETLDGWMVTHFKERQYSESYERVKRYRNAKSNGDSNVEEGVSVLSSSSSSSDSLSFSDSEGEGVGEGDDLPETPAQAMKHPDILTFQSICNRIPGQRDYSVVIETIQFLRKQHGEKLEDYLKPYWLAWSTRKTREGKSYRPSSLVWLCEWAINGEIPKVNGHEPQLQASAQDIIRKVAQSATRS